MRETPQAIFLDFHGTISDYTFWSTLTYREYSAIQSFLFKNKMPIVESWMRGSISTEEVIRIVARGSGISMVRLETALARELVCCPVHERIRDLIPSLAKFCTIFLVSDNMDIMARCFARDALSKSFSYAWFSSDHGRLKNSDLGFSYYNVSKKFGVDVSKSILFDDSCSSISTFGAMGGIAVRVTDPLDTVDRLGQLLLDLKEDALSSDFAFK
jgi:FMN phosphatase YigB (HAD superfamily)